MKKIISYPFTILAYTWFLFFICLFQPIQWICFNLFGYQAHKKSVDYLNFFLVRTVNFLFSNFEVKNLEVIPTGVPIIFASNHQGTFDIIGYAWFFRKFHPKFVSKIELGKGIPSVSYNLKHGGSVLIDRNDPKQALPAMKKMAEYIEVNHRSAVIFPEGTRTRNGKPKAFASNGLKILCKYAPSAYVVPVTINNSWEVFKYGNFPLGMGNKLKFTVHTPLKVSDYDFNTLFEMTEKAIVADIECKA
jgi:1-acyl-sn-glycerol-3-phosphate acyltransferase